MSESRKQFEEWALQTEHAFRDKNGLWFYPSHSARDMFTGWSARDSEVERLREALQRAADMLVSASHYVPKNGGLMKLIEVQDACFSLLSSQVKESGNG